MRHARAYGDRKAIADSKLEWEKTAFLLVDMEEDFASGGAIPVRGARAIVAPVRKFLLFPFKCTIATKDWHIDPGDHFGIWKIHCRANTLGSEFIRGLSAGDFDYIVYKGHYSAAYSGFQGITHEKIPLGDILVAENIDTVVIGGVATDHCVLATALDARQKYKLRTIVVLAICRGVSAKTTKAAIEQMRAAGVEIIEHLPQNFERNVR